MTHSENLAIEVRDVDVSSDNIPRLRGLSMRVAQATIVAVVGLNGAGKTTLLRAIMRPETISRGEIFVRGTPISGLAPFMIPKLGVGFVGQGAPVFSELTTRQNLSISGSGLDRGAFQNSVASLLEMFPSLSTRLDHRAGTLSGGERQMLGIARALIRKPTVLIMDEPTCGLHPNIAAALFNHIRKRCYDQRVSCLVAEQDEANILAFADEVIELDNGAISGSRTLKH